MKVTRRDSVPRLSDTSEEAIYELVSSDGAVLLEEFGRRLPLSRPRGKGALYTQSNPSLAHRLHSLSSEVLMHLLFRL